MVSEIELAGLTGSSPIGIMAALGVLRIASSKLYQYRPKIYWREQDDWVPVLVTDIEIECESLVSSIYAHLEQEKKDFFDDDDIRMKPEVFVEKAAKILYSSTYSIRTKADFWAAFGSELAIDKSKGLIKPTDFYMASGQQKFLNKVKNAMNSVNKSKIMEALFESWKYKDDHSLAMGWDPNTYRMHAFRSREPSTDNSPLCEVAAEWLAYESLPLFPTLAEGKKRITSGFIGDYFIWPIWVRPSDESSIRSLLLSSEVFDETLRGNLQQRGVAAIYGSRRMEFAKGYGSFQPGELIWAPTA